MDVVQERDTATGTPTVKSTRSGNIRGPRDHTIPAVGSPLEKDYFYHYDGAGNVTALTIKTQQGVKSPAEFGWTFSLLGLASPGNDHSQAPIKTAIS